MYRTLCKLVTSYVNLCINRFEIVRTKFKERVENYANLCVLVTNYDNLCTCPSKMFSWYSTSQQLTYHRHWWWQTDRSSATEWRLHATDQIMLVYRMRPPLTLSLWSTIFRQQNLVLTHNLGPIKNTFSSRVRSLSRTMKVQGPPPPFLHNKGCWAFTVNCSGRILSGAAVQRSVKDDFSSIGKTLIFDCSPDPKPVTDQLQNCYITLKFFCQNSKYWCKKQLELRMPNDSYKQQKLLLFGTKCLPSKCYIELLCFLNLTITTPIWSWSFWYLH